MTNNDRIADMSRTVYAWCAARTANAADAEDLSQEVLLAMLKAAPNLKEQQAFYGFMWSVAWNVYRAWLRRRREHAELTETIADPADVSGALEASEELRLLRREMTLLTSRFRQAAVMYYLRGMRVADVAQEMNISVSMVKYLLFKARNTIREGMDMERTYGEQSYQPRRLELRYWGHGPNHYYGMAGTLLRQNILFACYHDALTAEQIALAVGVGLPYMEEDLAELENVSLLLRDGAGYYRTNIVIFTEDFAREATALIAPQTRAISEAVKRCVEAQEEAVRALGFAGCDMGRAAFRWQMAALLLHAAVIGIAGERSAPELPMDKWGVPCVCWGVEPPASGKEAPFVFGASEMYNSREDCVQCMDFPVNGPMVHHALYQRPETNVFLRIARGEAEALSENDEAVAAELVRKGYVLRTEDGLRVNCPVYTRAQYREVLALLAPAAQEIAQLALTIRDKEAALLGEHVPEHLRDAARGMVYFRLFEDGVSLPVARLHEDGFLGASPATDVLPTTYVILAE